MEGKTLISAITLFVSAFAAWSAHEARIAAREAEQLARELDERSLNSQLTLDLLSRIHSTIIEPDDPRSAAAGCFFVSALEEAEKRDIKSEPYLVANFLAQMEAQDLWDPNCKTRLESVSDVVPAETLANEEDNQVVLGEWHAVIASYVANPSGCDLAKDTAMGFERLLTNVPDIEGYTIRLVRTEISDNYAVTIDAGDDQELAQSYVRAIRSVVGSPMLGRTGDDAFVQGNRNWRIDENCSL